MGCVSGKGLDQRSQGRMKYVQKGWSRMKQWSARAILLVDLGHEMQAGYASAGTLKITLTAKI